MEHFFQNVKGWFALNEQQWYKICVERAGNDAHFVEVGSWQGKSSAFLAVEIVNCNKKIQMDCVDSWEDVWMGTSGPYSEYKGQEVFDNFIKNMSTVVGLLNFRYIRQRSVDAAAAYQDKSLDLVFIDASHDYDNVHADITCWLPKIKSGGVISGHDWNFTEVKRAVTDLIPCVKSHGNTIWFKTVD
jgi:hypothetical protein